MRTSPKHQRKGVAKAMSKHIFAIALQRGYSQLSLEMGTKPAFIAASHLYHSFRFQACPPLGSYQADPFSTFMTKHIV